MGDSRNSNEKKDYLPQDKRLRLIVQILVAGVGVYAVISGIQQVLGAV